MKRKLLSALLVLTLVLSALPLGSIAVGAAEVTYAVNVTSSGEGTVSVEPTFAAEDEYVTVTLQAAEGWKIQNYKVFSEDKELFSVNYNGEFTEDTDGFNMPAADVTVSAVFVELGSGGDTPTPHNPGEECVISFDANGGEGSMSAPAVMYGEEFTLPECGFTKENRAFYKWEINGVLYDANITIPVTTDLTLKALWKYSSGSFTIDNSYDSSTTRVVGVLKMHDLRTGEISEYTEFDSETDSLFTDPRNDSVTSMVETAQCMLNDRMYYYGDVENDTLTVSDPEITETRDDRTYTYFDGEDLSYCDENGDYYSSVMITDGIYFNQWQITVTLEFDYTSVPMSYIHVLQTDGGYVDFWCDDYYGDYVQPYGVPEGAEVTLSAIPENGYVFKGWYKGNVNASSYDEMFTDELITTDNPYVFEAYDYPYVCAKFEYTGVERPQGDQIQVWITDGGKASVAYEPSYNDNPYIKPKDGNDYKSVGEVVQLWRGDEITVNAKPDNGYVFKGWYHVRIEWGPGDEQPKYEGEVISTDASYTYKPGVTALPGDSEPLRYICAAFERQDGLLSGDANGDGKINISDVTAIQRHTAQVRILTGDCLAAADINGDGVADISDATLLQRYLAEFTVEYPIGR